MANYQSVLLYFALFTTSCHLTSKFRHVHITKHICTSSFHFCAESSSCFYRLIRCSGFKCTNRRNVASDQALHFENLYFDFVLMVRFPHLSLTPLQNLIFHSKARFVNGFHRLINFFPL